MVICLERGEELHMAQLMPMPLTVSCFSKIQISFTLSLIHISEPTRLGMISYAVFCLKKKNK